MGLAAIVVLKAKTQPPTIGEVATRGEASSAADSAVPEGVSLSGSSAVANEKPSTSGVDVAPPIEKARPAEASAAPRLAPPTAAPRTALLPTGRVADPGDELSLVRDMQAALRAGDAERALGIANEHALKFPRGALIEEREGLRAVARCQLAPADARPEILARFLGSFDGSPYTARVKAACQ
jgi:hypothetical protein